MNRVIASADFYNNPSADTLNVYKDCLEKAINAGQMSPNHARLIISKAEEYLKEIRKD